MANRIIIRWSVGLILGAVVFGLALWLHAKKGAGDSNDSNHVNAEMPVSGPKTAPTSKVEEKPPTTNESRAEPTEGWNPHLSPEEILLWKKYHALMKEEGNTELWLDHLLTMPHLMFLDRWDWNAFGKRVPNTYLHILSNKNSGSAQERILHGRAFLQKSLDFLEHLRVEELMERDDYLKYNGTSSIPHQAPTSNYRLMESAVHDLLRGLKQMVFLADYLENSDDMKKRYSEIAMTVIRKFDLSPDYVDFIGTEPERSDLLKSAEALKKDIYAP